VNDENGQVIEPTITTAYDLMSNPSFITDACGTTLHKKHTIRGKPYHIFYPDGTEEKNVYNLNGTLPKAFHVNGTYTLYTYDG
jgi:hypothetical protein